MLPLERRIIDISYKKGLSHIGSCLTAVQLIDDIYMDKKMSDIFILSSGHAGLALYAVLEKFGYGDAEELFEKHGVHPNMDPEHGIFCSSGSLGHGIGIAVGIALADRSRDVYVLMSDGECSEGSVWEALRIASELGLKNLHVTVNCNGYGANSRVDTEWLSLRMADFFPVKIVRTSTYKWPAYLQGQQAHYHILTREEYESL